MWKVSLGMAVVNSSSTEESDFELLILLSPCPECWVAGIFHHTQLMCREGRNPVFDAG